MSGECHRCGEHCLDCECTTLEIALDRLSGLIQGATLMLQSRDGIHEVSIMMHDREDAEAVLEALEEISA